jgi:hypothetical protein
MNSTILNFDSWKQNSINNAINFDEEVCKINVHVLLSYDKEDEIYNAHALEFDIVASTTRKKNAKKEIMELVANHIAFCMAYNNKDKIVSPAPDEYWRKFYLALERGTIDNKPKIPKLNLTNLQIPYRPSEFNQVCIAGG